MSSTLSADARPDEGFTLVEVIVSMVLLGIVAVAILPVTALGLKTLPATRHTAAATQLASAELSEARSRAVTLTCAGLQDAISSADGHLSASVPGGFQVVTTASAPTGVAPGVCQVATTVKSLSTSSSSQKQLATATTFVVVRP